MMRPTLVAGLACAVFGLASATALKSETAVPGDRGEEAIARDCSTWTLDGYRLGMRGDEILAVRSVTLHVEGQAQVIEPGSFHGVLVLDALNRLTKWDVTYHTTDGTALRAELRELFGEPTLDVSGSILDNESETVRQRRTVWWSRACDAAIIVHQNTSVRGAPVHSVSAALVRASSFKQGIAALKTFAH
jgi:hypothetical protein